MSLRSNQGGYAASTRKDGALVTQLMSAIDATSVSKDALAGKYFATESLDPGTDQRLTDMENTLRASISSAASALGIFDASKADDVRRMNACESAAVIGAMAIRGGSAGMLRNSDVSHLAGENSFVLPATGVENYLGKRAEKMIAAVEAFDQTARHMSAVYSAGFNYAAPIQSDFSEAIFPLLTLAPDQLGFSIVVPRLCVWRGMQHEVSGRIKGGEKIDLCRAGVDPSILSRKRTAVIPVWRAAAADLFVDAAEVVPVDYTEEGENFKTSYLKCGVMIESLLGISQTDAKLDRGQADQTDALDPNVKVERVLFKFGADYVSYNIVERMGSNFTRNPQGRAEDYRLNFDNSYIVLDGNSLLRVDSSPLVALEKLKTNKWAAIMTLSLAGTMNTEYSSIMVNGNILKMTKIIDKDGNPVDTAHPDYVALAAVLNSGKVEGFTQTSYRVNSNMNERGDLLDANRFTQTYEIPLLSPMTYQRPINQAAEHAKEDYENLITGVRFRQEGDCVTAIFDTVRALEDYVKVPFNHTDAPSGLGAGRFSVKPYLADLRGDNAIDVEKIWNATNSMDAPAAVNAVILNKLRDVAYRMWILSEYRSGLKLHGINPDSVWLVLACDPYIRRYLTEYGDLRSLTEKFRIKIVDTDVKAFRGLVFMTFQIFDENRNTAPNVMSFGNFVWRAESVISSQMPRGERNAVETIVQPSWRFVVHCPVAGIVEVKNIAKVFDDNSFRVKP